MKSVSKFFSNPLSLVLLTAILGIAVLQYIGYLDDLNAWIIAYREIVTIVALPLITVWFTNSVNSAAEARAEKTRAEAETRDAGQRLVQLELARRMKLADFRQNWIDEMRDNFAKIISAIGEGDSEKPALLDVNFRIQRVLMRMNPQEDHAKAVFEKLMNLISSGSTNDKSKKEDIAFDLTNLVNALLKTEWERLKKELREYQIGEPTI
jgi:hypothetical protein